MAVRHSVWTDITLTDVLERPERTGVKAVDDYIRGFVDLYNDVQEALKERAPDIQYTHTILKRKQGRSAKL